LIHDPSIAVRRSLVFNKGNIPEFVFETLATDQDDGVRWQVAYNHSASPGALKRLTQDSSDSVREAAIQSLERQEQWLSHK
jgi:hypothetical protein